MSLLASHWLIVNGGPQMETIPFRDTLYRNRTSLNKGAKLLVEKGEDSKLYLGTIRGNHHDSDHDASFV
jgi:hypothetical protein